MLESGVHQVELRKNSQMLQKIEWNKDIDNIKQIEEFPQKD